MFEKVNPSHPDKIADRIAGAMVDLAYEKEDNPKIAVEVLIGHGECNIISETSTPFTYNEVDEIVKRIAGKEIKIHYSEYPQNFYLAANQVQKMRCGDNGIFKGMPVTDEQKMLTFIVKDIYSHYPTDGKYIMNHGDLICCQSCVDTNKFRDEISEVYCDNPIVNPLGDWTGGTNVDTGATNRKLGSDMGDSVTGGGLHGKDLSKADVSVNIYAFCKAQMTGKPVELSCAIGDEYVDDMAYSEIVESAKRFIKSIGGFEKFAEWGLIR